MISFDQSLTNLHRVGEKLPRDSGKIFSAKYLSKMWNCGRLWTKNMNGRTDKVKSKLDQVNNANSLIIFLTNL